PRSADATSWIDREASKSLIYGQAGSRATNWHVSCSPLGRSLPSGLFTSPFLVREGKICHSPLPRWTVCWGRSPAGTQCARWRSGISKPSTIPCGENGRVAVLGESICPYCGVGCRLRLEGEGGRVHGVRGVEEAAANLGRLCAKGAQLGPT